MSSLISVQSRRARFVVVTRVGQRSCAVNFKRFGCINGQSCFRNECTSVYRNEYLALEAAAAWLEAAA